MAKRARKPVASKTVRRSDRRDPRSVSRLDGFFNNLSGHGTSRDRRSFTSHTSNPVTEQLAISMWRGDDIMARIIEMLPREAVRRGINLKVTSTGKKKGGGKEIAEEVMGELERLDMLERVKLAGQYERAFGGAAIFPVLTGALGDLAEPLDAYVGNIARVEALHVLEARELRPASWYTDITHPKFRQPETYRLWPLAGASGTQIQNEVIHESRLITFPGIRVSNQLQPGQRPGWGDSVVMRCYEVVADFGLAWGSAATLLHEFATGVYKMDQLEDLLATKAGKQLVDDKLALIEMVKSTLRTRVIGKNDDFTRQSTPVSGLEGLLIQLAQRLAAAADMPVTQLMGMSPAGMNATGESDTRGWYDRVEVVRSYYRAMVEWVIRIVMLQNDGPCGGVEPDVWSMEWVPLWQPSEKEVAETRKIVMDTDKGYFDMGLPFSKIANARWAGDTFSMDMHWDPGELDDLEAQTNLTNTDPATMTDEELAALGVTRAKPVDGADPNAPADQNAPADPNAPAPEAGTPGVVAPAPAVESIQSTVLNGAQVSSLVAVVTAVVNKEIPREAAAKIIELAYQVTPDVALALLGPETFEAKPAAPAPPFGGGAPVPPPGAPGKEGEEKPADGEKPQPGATGEPGEGEEKPADEGEKKPLPKAQARFKKKPKAKPEEPEPEDDEEE